MPLWVPPAKRLIFLARQGPRTDRAVVAVTVRCDGCIAVHVDAAIRHGATPAEIAEALGVATAVNAGAALVYSTRVMDAYSAHVQANEATG